MRQHSSTTQARPNMTRFTTDIIYDYNCNEVARNLHAKEKYIFEVLYNSKSERIALLHGCSKASLLHAIRQAFHLPQQQKIRLCNSKGEPLRLQGQLPTTIHVIPHGKPLDLGKSSSNKQLGRPPCAKLPQSLPQESKKPPLRALVKMVLPRQTADKTLAQASALLEQYGHFVQLSLPDMPAVYLSDDPAVVQDVTTHQHLFTATQQPAGNSSLWGRLQQQTVRNSVMAAHDALLGRNSNHGALLSALHARPLQHDFPALLSATYELLAHVQGLDEQPWDAHDAMQRTACDAAFALCCAQPPCCFYSSQHPPTMQALQHIAQEKLSRYGLLRWDSSPLLLPAVIKKLVQTRRLAQRAVQPSCILDMLLQLNDPQTGQPLCEQEVDEQLASIVLMVYHMTAATCLYGLFELARRPQQQQQLAQEADNILPTNPGQSLVLQQVEQLQQTDRFVRETLRIHPVVPLFHRYVACNTSVANRYSVCQGESIGVVTKNLQQHQQHWRQPAVFDPSRFLPQNRSSQHPGSYYPFGLGLTHHVGFQFALTQAKLIVAKLCQNSRIVLEDPGELLQESYKLVMCPTSLRLLLEPRCNSQNSRVTAPAANQTNTPVPTKTKQQPTVDDPDLLVLYGSNMGASQELAHRVAKQGQEKGLQTVVGTLDDYVNRWPRHGILVVVCSSYNGEPPDNAVQCISWIQNQKGSSMLQHLHYAVLGCGNKQWRATYQRIPRLLDDHLHTLGAHRILRRGECDADGDFEDTAHIWCKHL